MTLVRFHRRFKQTQICPIVNFMPPKHLHFGTGFKMYCKSNVSSCDSTLMVSDLVTRHDVSKLSGG